MQGKETIKICKRIVELCVEYNKTIEKPELSKEQERLAKELKPLLEIMENKTEQTLNKLEGNEQIRKGLFVKEL